MGGRFEKVVVLLCSRSLIPKKLSDSDSARDGCSCASFRMYVAHFGFIGIGVNISNPLRGGGSLLELSQGSCSSKIWYFGLLETKESTAYVLDSPLAQFKERIILVCSCIVLMIEAVFGWSRKLQDRVELMCQTL